MESAFRHSGRAVLVVNTKLVPEAERPHSLLEADRTAMEGKGGDGPAAIRNHGHPGRLPV